MATWQLIDVGRTMIGKVPGMYEYVQNYAHQHFPKERADLLAERAGKRETNPELITQDVFSDFCKIWVDGYKSGQWKCDARDFVFPDTVPFVAEQKGKGKKIGVLTNGSQAFTDILLGVKFDKPIVIGGTTYSGLPQLVDQYFLGEEWGDKNHPESFCKIYQWLDSQDHNIEAIFDDKVSVVKAASEALKRYWYGDLPMYFWTTTWMNRKNKHDPRIDEVVAMFSDRFVNVPILGVKLNDLFINATSFDDYVKQKYSGK